GLVIKSNQAIDITTALDALATGSGAIVGRYGPAAPIVVNRYTEGIKVHHVNVGPLLSGNRTLDINLTNMLGGPLLISNLPTHPAVGRLTPIVTVNNNVVSPPYGLAEVRVSGQTHVVLQTNISDSVLSNGGGVVRV